MFFQRRTKSPCVGVLRSMYVYFIEPKFEVLGAFFSPRMRYFQYPASLRSCFPGEALSFFLVRYLYVTFPLL